MYFAVGISKQKLLAPVVAAHVSRQAQDFKPATQVHALNLAVFINELVKRVTRQLERIDCRRRVGLRRHRICSLL